MTTEMNLPSCVSKADTDAREIVFHHNKIDHKEAESRLRAANIDGSYLTREQKSTYGNVFILSYMINSSCIKHIIPHICKLKLNYHSKITDFSTEVYSVIESIKDCKFPLINTESEETH